MGTGNRSYQTEVIFLGTGTSTGVPVIACNCEVCSSSDPRDKRFRTSALVNINGYNFIIDCGPDFRFQMLKNKVEDIEAILFTHEHRDHIAGLDDIRAFNYILNKKIEIYGSERVMNGIKTEFPYIFTETRYFGAPQINIHTISENPFKINDIDFIPINVLHNQMVVQGFRIGDLTYITDASFIPEEEFDKIAGTKVLIINALRKSTHISHFSLSQALEVIEKTGPEKAYITHISHFMGKHEEVQATLPENIFLAYDNLKITI